MSSLTNLAGAAAVAAVALALNIAYAEGGRMAGTPGDATATHPPRATTEAGSDSDTTAVNDAKAAARTAEANLQSRRADRAELAKAIRSKNTAAAKVVLERNGFAADQLADAKIVLNDETGGGDVGDASRTTITIEVSCCPLTIIITIRL